MQVLVCPMLGSQTEEAFSMPLISTANSGTAYPPDNFELCLPIARLIRSNSPAPDSFRHEAGVETGLNVGPGIP